MTTPSLPACRRSNKLLSDAIGHVTDAIDAVAILEASNHGLADVTEHLYQAAGELKSERHAVMTLIGRHTAKAVDDDSKRL